MREFAVLLTISNCFAMEEIKSSPSSQDETPEIKRARAIQVYEECKDKYADMKPFNVTIDDISPDIKNFTLEQAQMAATFYRQSLTNTTFLLNQSNKTYEANARIHEHNVSIAQKEKARADENWEYFEKARTLAVTLQSEFSQAKEIISQLRAEIAEKDELIAQLQRTTNFRLVHAISEEERINEMVEMSYQSYLEIRDRANMGPPESPEQRTASNKRMKEKLYRDARNAFALAKAGIDIPTVSSAPATIVFHAPTDPNVSLLTAQMLSNQRQLAAQQHRQAVNKMLKPGNPMPGIHAPQSR